LAVFRDQNRNGLSDRLFCSVVEDALRSPIPAGDNAIEVFAYDCVIAIFNNRCERTQLLFNKRTPSLFGAGSLDCSPKIVTAPNWPAILHSAAPSF
jgi:hypothetical protein